MGERTRAAPPPCTAGKRGSQQRAKCASVDVGSLFSVQAEDECKSIYHGPSVAEDLTEKCQRDDSGGMDRAEKSQSDIEIRNRKSTEKRDNYHRRFSEA